MADRLYAVFGGTGFLGRRIARALLATGAHVRIAVRHPDRAAVPGVEAVYADVRDRASVARAIDGAAAAVNAVSAYAEGGGITYRAIHEDGARRIAEACASGGIPRLVQLSGIGADPQSTSRYIRARGRGELAVRDAMPDCVIVRPAVMFGDGDALTGPISRLARSVPVVPLVGGGATRLQPAWAEDVARAIAKILTEGGADGRTLELGGPDVLTLRAVVELTMRHLGTSRPIVPVPFALAHLAAALADRLPRPPLTLAQIDLLRIDTVVAPEIPGFSALGIAPRALDDFMTERFASAGT